MEFLMAEYNQMFEEKRHYDNRSNLFITMYFAFLTICVSVVSFTYESLGSNMRYLILLLSVVQALTGIVVAISLYFNRVSAVKTYRQINAIREFCLDNDAVDFIKYNKMNFKDQKFLKLDSMHFAIVALVFCLNSVCVGIVGFCVLCILVNAVILGIASLFFHFSIYIGLLYNRDKKESAKKKVNENADSTNAKKTKES